MLKKPSFYTAFMCAIFCSGAIALQPTVHAGSLSLNTGIRPTTASGGVTPTASTNTSSGASISRGSAISKFSQPVTKVTSNKNNNQSGGGSNTNNNSGISSDELNRLREQIAALTTAQQQLADNQISPDSLQDTIENTVASLDLTKNTSLKDTLDGIDSVQSSLESLQTAQSQLNTSIDTAINDSFNEKLRDRLVIEGFIEGGEIPFAKKTDIKPDTIVEKIVTDPDAAAAFSEKITSDLKGHHVLKQNGDLNVATKEEIAPTEIADKISKSSDAIATLSGKIGPDETAVRGLIQSGLESRGIVQGETLKVATKDELDTLATKAITTDNVTLSDYAKKSDIFDNNTTTIKTTALPTTVVDDTKLNTRFGALFDNNNKLKSDALPSDAVTTSTLIDTNTNKIKSDLVVQPDLSGYAQKSDIFDNNTTTIKTTVLPTSVVDDNKLSTRLANFLDNNNKLKSDALPTGTVTSTNLSSNLKTLNVLDNNGNLNVPNNIATTDTLNDYAKKTDILDNEKIKDSILPDTVAKATNVSDLATRVNSLEQGSVDADDVASKLKTDQNFLDSVKGESVKVSDVTTALKGDSNFLASVKGDQGPQGNPGTSVTVSEVTTALKGDSNFLASVKGDQGPQGNPGTSVTVSEVTTALKGDSNFLASVKGDQGPAGTGIDYKGEIAQYSLLSQKTCNTDTKGEAWYNQNDTLLYICTCEGTNCSFPTDGNGVPFRGPQGTPGQNAKPVEQQYCENNYETVKLLYPNKAWTSSGASVDCADTSLFSNAEYSAIMGGATAYCLSLVKDPSVLGDLSSGIGKKLKTALGETPMSAFISSTNNTEVKRLQLTGFKTSKLSNTTGDFMTACKARYDEIMSGEDAETPWHAYCMETNNNVSNLTKIIQPLYGSTLPNGVPTCNDFTSDQYNAIMGGAKAYCLSLATNPTVLGDLTTGIGKKLKDVLGDKVSDFKSASTVQDRLSMTGFQKASSTSLKFTDACEEKYNEIMSGADGESAWYAYCAANSNENLTKYIQPLFGSTLPNGVPTCKDFTKEQYDAIQGGAKAYCLLLAQDLNAGTLNLTSGIGAKLNAKLTTTDTTKTITALSGTKNMSTVLNATFNNGKKFLPACEEKYNEIMEGAEGQAGESAAYTWCKAHTFNANDTRLITTASTVRKMSAAKTLNAFTARNNVATGLTKSGNQGYFSDLDACLAAVEADPSLMGGETAEEIKYNSDVENNNVIFAISTDGKTAFNTNKAGYLAAMKGEDGAVFTPVFDSETGNLSWSSSKTGVSAPATMKIANTTSELQTLVDGRISNNSSITGLLSDVSGLKTNALTATSLATELGTTNSSLRSAVNDVVGANSAVNTLSNDVSNLKNNALTASSLATELTSANSSVKSALSDAGFATTSEIGNRALTMADLSNMLSNKMLVADASGAIGLSPSVSTAGNSVATKLDAVGNLNSMKASTSIATAVANVSASANNASGIEDPTKCNSTDYMFWNSTAGKCQTCPEPITKYIGGNDRCMCVEKFYAFNAAGGTCDKQSEGQQQCAATEGYYWNTQDQGSCQKCPEGTYYKNGCMCEEDGTMLNTFAGKCMPCDPESGLEWDKNTRTCSCKNGGTINYEAWVSDPANACADK